jgi:microcin C transport system substrate-binding protein
MYRILTALLALAGFAMSAPAMSQDGEWRHSTSLVGEPKYASGFTRFDYVNSDAPKGGVVRQSETGSFDSLNFVPPKGAVATGLGLIYDTLMTSSLDEVSTEYGLLAEALKFPEDFSSVTYKLRDGAKWHDGEPVTTDDVIWSFDNVKKASPQQAFYYQHVEKAEATAPSEVTFTFDQAGNRELPHIVGQLLILPRHYWQGTDAKGKKRDLAASTLEPPLGSGPYRIASVIPGRTIVYERVSDYWGKDLPVNIGANNFDEIRYEYFRDETVELQALKGDQLDWRQESTARVWATGYNAPAVRDGRIKLEMFEEPYRGSGLMVGFIFNLNRDKFKDPLVRRAFNYAFPYEEINKSIFYGAYSRIKSYFGGLDFASTGLPEGRELEILNALKDQVPPEVFTEEFVNPLNTDSSAERSNLRQALTLFKQAGWRVKDGELVNADGEQMKLEYLMNGPRFEKIALRYQAQLAKIGVEMSIRPVDTSQYGRRVDSRDFDMIFTGWAESISPGNEQIEFFGSESADREGSRNYGAIKNPAVDAIIDKIIEAPDRAELEAAVAALDRVLLWNHYLVPGWTLRAARIAHWDRFGRPDPLPEFSIGFPSIWWWDEEKAATVRSKQ